MPAARSRRPTSPVGQLVADDDREVRLVACGRLELLAELAPTELRARRDAGGPKRRGDAQAADRVVRVGADDDGHRHGLRDRGHAGLVEREDQPVDADPEADPRRRPPTEQLDETVIAPPAADRLLLALAPGDVELERGPGVVVEAADQTRLEPVSDLERVEVRADGREMLGARIAQPIGDLRRRGIERGHRRVMRIEQAQHVALEPCTLELGQPVADGPVVLGQLGDVGGPAGRVADRVQPDLDAGEPGVAVEPPAQLDDLRVDGRTGVADGLDVELPELAVAARLGTVVPEHRPGLGELDRLGPGLHPVLDVRPDDPGGRLGAERPALGVLGPGREPEELLLDDVGHLADPALEDVGQLEHRRLDPAIAIACGQVGCEALQAGPGRGLGRQEVARAARRSKVGHRAEV